MNSIAQLASFGFVAALAGYLALAWPAGRRLRAAGDYDWDDEGPSVEAANPRSAHVARPMIQFTPAVEPGFTKIGGAPALADGMRWPLGVEGPRPFLMQIDLRRARAAGGPDWLPTSGALFAFLDEAEFGSGREVRVRYTETLGEKARPFPLDLPASRRFKERWLAMAARDAAPSADWLATAPRRTDGDVQRARMTVRHTRADHRLGGFPAELQGGQMALECEHLWRELPGSVYDQTPSPEIRAAAEHWRLLLQIDAEPELGLVYGAGARFYVFIREDDARRGRFSQTVTLIQER